MLILVSKPGRKKLTVLFVHFRASAVIDGRVINDVDLLGFCTVIYNGGSEREKVKGVDSCILAYSSFFVVEIRIKNKNMDA